MKKEVTNSLRKLGLIGKALHTQEWIVISQLADFLGSFEGFTDIVSGASTCLSLIPLLRSEIEDTCKPKPEDQAELKELKKLILKNLEARFPMTPNVILSALLDPDTKGLDILQLNAEQKAQLIEAAMKGKDSKESTPSDIDGGPALIEIPDSSQSSESSQPLTKRQKLLLKHSKSEKSAKEATAWREEVMLYLASKPDVSNSPEDFWKKHDSVYPKIAQLAKEVLTQSCSSVPVESMFSSMGIMLNHKRSQLAPYRANELSFIHDNLPIYKDLM
jgi:hypothetical protein